MKKYFYYEFKKNGALLIGLTVVMLLLHIPALLTASSDYAFGALRLYWISGLGGVLAAFIPVYLFSYKMKKRSLDLYYALPVPRREIFSVKYILGLIFIFVPYTVTFATGAIVGCARCTAELFTVYFVPQYFASLIGIYIIYSICTFLFTRAHTLADGIVTMAMGFFAPLLVAFALYTLLATGSAPLYRVIAPYAWLPYSLLDSVTAEFQRYIIYGQPLAADTHVIINESVSAGLFTVLSALATYFTIRNERNTLAEEAEQITTSPFGYKVLLPVYAACSVVMIDLTERYAALLLPLAAVILFLGAALYKRTLKIGWKTALSLIIGGLVGAAAQLIAAFVW